MNSNMNKKEKKTIIANNNLSNKAPVEVDFIFDNQFLLKQLSGNSDLVKTILAKFVASMKNQVKNIHTAIEERDVEQVVATGHKLKGAAVTIGCNQLGKIAGEIEMAGVESNIDKAQILSQQLDPCYIVTRKAVESGLFDIENHL